MKVCVRHNIGVLGQFGHLLCPPGQEGARLDLGFWAEPLAVGGVGTPFSSPLPPTGQLQHIILPVGGPVEAPHHLQEEG